MECCTGLSLTVIVVIVILAVFEYIMKGFALWKCGRNNHTGWFVAIFIINTAGILPLIYLLKYRNKNTES